MVQQSGYPISRRRFLKTSGVAALAAGPAVIIPGRAQPRTLSILRGRSGTPAFNDYTVETATAWGEANDVKVTVDFVGPGDIAKEIAKEAAAGKGHDIVRYWQPLAVHEDHTIDHTEVYEEAQRRFGKPHEFALRHTYNAKTKRHYGFSDIYGAPFVLYRQDLWQGVGRVPDNWDDVRRGGRHIKLLHERPVGISLQSTGLTETTWRAVLFSFGGSVQNADGQPALKSAGTLAALEFAKALFDEAMSEEMLQWVRWDNARALLGGETSMIVATISAMRNAEKRELPGINDIWLAPPPEGPAGRVAPPAWINTQMIWKFSKNIDIAKRYLADSIADTRGSVLISDLNNVPVFPESVPDWPELIADQPTAVPRDKYKVLASDRDWLGNVGYPGNTNIAASEVHNSGMIPRLFANVVSGEMTAADAIDQADRQVRVIYAKWRELGKI